MENSRLCDYLVAIFNSCIDGVKTLRVILNKQLRIQTDFVCRPVTTAWHAAAHDAWLILRVGGCRDMSNHHIEHIYAIHLKRIGKY